MAAQTLHSRAGVSRSCRALGDNTRREILELLAAQGSLRAGEIAQAFPGSSRPAVSRHLRVLRESGLVLAATQTAQADGREVRYRANPAALAEVEAWVARYRAYWASGLDTLARLAEQKR